MRSAWLRFIRLAVLGLALTASPAAAATLTSPVLPGDVFGTEVFGNSLLQYRGGSVISTVAGTNLGGVASDGAGNLWFAQGDGGTVPFAIEMIGFGTTTSSAKISGAAVNAPSSATDIRDIVLDSSGNLYAMFQGGSNTVMKYAPDGSGGFLAGIVVGSFGSSFGDYGAGRLDLCDDEQFLITGNWTTKNLHTMNVTSGAVQNASPGADTSGAAQIGALGANAVLFSERYGLSLTTFNPATGATGTSSTRLTTPDYFFDGMTYVPEAGRTYFTYRLAGGTIRYATDSELAAAAATGPQIDVATLPLVYQGSAASINRDLAVIGPSPLQSPVGKGDVFVVDYNLQRVHHFHGSQHLGTLDFGAGTLVGGVYTDPSANLYIAGNGVGVYRVAAGQTDGQWLIQPDQLASGLTVRDTAVDARGNIYVSYLGDNGRVEKFTPAGHGYDVSTLGQFGITNGDYGNLHMWLTDNGKYLLASGRNSGMIVAMSTEDGSITTWYSSGFNLAAEIALDPFTNDYLVFGTDSGSTHRLRGLSFDPETGTFGTTVDILTSTDAWVDAAAFDPQTGDLYMSVRNNQLRLATYQQVLDARAGTPFDITGLPLLVDSGMVQIARDMAVANVPEPGSLALMFSGIVGLLVLRRRVRAKAAAGSA